MCGIFGIIGDSNTTHLLMQGLKRMEYRGYDSSGLAILNGSMEVYKTVSRIRD